jgi:transcriptional regulator with XRE-family HTH domain
MVRRRQLALALRGFREQAGLSVSDAAARLLSSPSKISRLENAQRNATLRDVRDLCEAYGVPAGIRDELMEIAQESRRRGWWQESNLDAAMATLIGMENAAISISEFQPIFVPGLLQTPGYAEAIIDVFQAENPINKKAFFDVRMRRQKILLGDSAPVFRVLLDEAVVRRPVGGSDVMREQIERLLATYSNDSTTSIRVIPSDVGAYLGMLNGFIVLEFDQLVSEIQGAGMPGVVYIETLIEDKSYDQPAEVKQYLDAFARLERSALDPVSSADLLEGVRRDLQ